MWQIIDAEGIVFVSANSIDSPSLEFTLRKREAKNAIAISNTNGADRSTGVAQAD